jgi:hypothetical protein
MASFSKHKIFVMAAMLCASVTTLLPGSDLFCSRMWGGPFMVAADGSASVIVYAKILGYNDKNDDLIYSSRLSMEIEVQDFLKGSIPTNKLSVRGGDPMGHSSHQKEYPTNTEWIRAGQRNDNVPLLQLSPFKEFVSHCQKSIITERISEYRTKIDALVKQHKIGFSPVDDGVYGLMGEIARQGDFQGLELLEKDLPQNLRKATWMGAQSNATDDAKKLLIKWAKEKPGEPILMQYLPDGINLLIEMAEDIKAKPDDRVLCLTLLANMRATNVIERIRKLIKDESLCCLLDGPPNDSITTVGMIAAETVSRLEKAK